MSGEFPGIQFYTADSDEFAGKAVAEMFGVDAGPTFLVFKAGEKVDEMTGTNEDGLRDMLAMHQ